MWILLFRAFPFTSATPLFKVGLLRYKIEAAQNIFLSSSCLTRGSFTMYNLLNFLGSLNFSVQLFAPQKSEPYRAAIPYASKLAGKAGLQVLPYAVGKRISFGVTSSPLRWRRSYVIILDEHSYYLRR